MALWTGKAENELRKLWNQGKTAREISNYFDGGFSKNAVIGKVHRLGLKQRRPAFVRANDPSYKHPMTIKKEDRETETAEINITLYGDGKSMIDLLPDNCRWPVGDVYCSAKIEKKSYCKKHYSIAYKGK